MSIFKNIRSRIRNPRDIHSRLTTENPLMLNGELVVVDIDNEVMVKIGDGTNQYENLPFISSIPKISKIDYYTDLPSSAMVGEIYIVKDSDGLYRWNGESWERIASIDSSAIIYPERVTITSDDGTETVKLVYHPLIGPTFFSVDSQSGSMVNDPDSKIMLCTTLDGEVYFKNMNESI